MSGDELIGTTHPTAPWEMTWVEALAFANRMSERDSLPRCYELKGCISELGGMECDEARTIGSAYERGGYRLPTGAEWEYVARVGTETSVYNGEILERGLLCTCNEDPVLDMMRAANYFGARVYGRGPAAGFRLAQTLFQ